MRCAVSSIAKRACAKNIERKDASISCDSASNYAEKRRTCLKKQQKERRAKKRSGNETAIKECVMRQTQGVRADIDAANRTANAKEGRRRKGEADVKNVKQQKRGRRKRDKITEKENKDVKSKIE